MQALCIGEMRHGTPASLSFCNGALCTFLRGLRAFSDGEGLRYRGFFIGRHKGGQGMQALCIGEMRHGTPASLSFCNGALCTFLRGLRAFSDGEGLRYIGIDI